MDALISPLAHKALAIGQKHHWGFQVVDKIDIPEEPTYKAGWWLESLQEAPQEAQDRVMALERAGIRVKGIVLAHEAPPLLPAPAPDIKIAPIVSDARKVAVGAGAVLLVASQVVAVAAAAAVAMPVLLLAAMVDPKVLVVLEDGTMMEVVRWLA